MGRLLSGVKNKEILKAKFRQKFQLRILALVFADLSLYVERSAEFPLRKVSLGAFQTNFTSNEFCRLYAWSHSQCFDHRVDKLIIVQISHVSGRANTAQR